MEYGGANVFTMAYFIVFAIAIAGFVVIIVKAISTWNRNNNLPRLMVSAKIVSKRKDTSHHRHANAGDLTGAHGYSIAASTQYYVTFQVESGDRMELSVAGSEYRMLAEGDTGQLYFQGTKYLSFKSS